MFVYLKKGEYRFEKRIVFQTAFVPCKAYIKLCIFIAKQRKSAQMHTPKKGMVTDMTAEERKNAYARLLRECPEILTPRMVARWTRQSKNTVYAEIKSGDIPAVPYRGGYLIAKADLIDYMVAHAEDAPAGRFSIGSRRHE